MSDEEEVHDDERALARREALIAAVSPDHYVQQYGEGGYAVLRTVLARRWLVRFPGGSETLVEGPEVVAQRFAASHLWGVRWGDLELAVDDD